MTTDTLPFSYDDDPANPGWKLWRLSDPTRYNEFLGPLAVRLEGDLARVRMVPERKHSNLGDNVHGGTLLGFIDTAMFAACRAFGVLGADRAVTLDLSTQFIGGGVVDAPIDAEIELLRETGRLLFVRGVVVQGETRVAAFNGTLRKLNASR